MAYRRLGADTAVHVHLLRGGAEIGTETVINRRVQHPDFGGWLLLSGIGGGRFVARGLHLGKHAQHQATAHLVTLPCPPDAAAVRRG